MFNSPGVADMVADVFTDVHIQYMVVQLRVESSYLHWSLVLAVPQHS